MLGQACLAAAVEVARPSVSMRLNESLRPRLFLCNRPLSPYKAPNPDTDHAGDLDLSDVRSQHQAKGALEIAAAGGHNLLML